MSYRAARDAPARPMWGLLGWLLLSFAAGGLGALASADAAAFYAALARPSWAPPAWLFGPVWSVLYVLMAVAAWLVWRREGWAGARVALWLFVAQLVANALWTWLFFAWRQGALALADIAVLVILVVATLIAFARVSRAAAWLMVPYLAWVSFAAALTYAMVTGNPRLLG
ncbi:MAG: TspO/MBR family protein [Casimicrobiaceae bacterium]